MIGASGIARKCASTLGIKEMNDHRILRKQATEILMLPDVLIQYPPLYIKLGECHINPDSS
jgi:hypothetical protein